LLEKGTEVHIIEGGYKGERKNYQNKDTFIEINRLEDEATVSLGQHWSTLDFD